MRHLMAVALVLALAQPVGADHCESYTSSEPELVVQGAPGDVYYVDLELCQTEGCLTTVWIYEESNGIPGWQRGDAQACASSSLLRCGGDEVVDDTCHGMIQPDTIVF